MIKYYCDICGKEISNSKEEFLLLLMGRENKLEGIYGKRINKADLWCK